MGLSLQTRDLKIMRSLFAYRVMTYGQIHTKFFSNRFETVARNRIRKLVKHGYLRSFSAERGNQVIRGLSLMQKAWPLIDEKWEFEVDRPHFLSESIEHDFRIVDLALRFERLKSFERFLTENLLQSSSSLARESIFRDLVNLQSDGAIILKDQSGGSILYAVELEISKKAPDRYIKKLEGYYRAGGIDGVLYICGNQEIANAIAKADRISRTGNESIVYLSSESNVLKSGEKIIFRGIDEGGIGLT